MRILPILILALSLVGSSACSSTATPRGHYESLVKELAKAQGTQGTRGSVRKKLEKRFAKVESWNKSGKLATPEDKLWGAATLIHASSPERIALSIQLSRQAAQAGEQRALPLLAQGLDKQALQNGRPQPYGTQYLFHPDPGIWVLYDIDPKVTDTERAEMGLPPLRELHAKVKELNVQHQMNLLEAERNR